ncbi:MAG: toll/interleukin-1 receptor domain-containing protein [Saprospiraceae bacterium]
MDSVSIFISYSSKDRPFAEGLTEVLRSLGANVWIDQNGIELGNAWDNDIEEALDNSKTFILLISPTSIKSDNVKDEVSIAINDNKNLIPIKIKPFEIKLPMRWRRLQYADLTEDPERAIKKIIKDLDLQEEAFSKLKNILSLLKDSKNITAAPTDEANSGHQVIQKNNPESSKINLLPSEVEFKNAIVMHEKGIKKNKQLILYVAIVSIILLSSLLLMDIATSKWVIILGCLSINLLSIQPFGSIKKGERILGLIKLLKLKRDRLIRVINKLTENHIDDFNNDFENYITM